MLSMVNIVSAAGGTMLKLCYNGIKIDMKQVESEIFHWAQKSVARAKDRL